MLLYKLSEMFSSICVILFLTFIFSSFFLYDKTAWRYVTFCPFTLADITEETDVMVSEDQESEKPKTLLHKLQSSTGSSSYVYMKNQGWLVSAGLCDSVC